jgi:4-aminobutyrate aminotransferase-like enzyme
LSCGARGNVIRFLPALVISDKLLDEALSVVRETLIVQNNSLKKAS